MSDPLVAIKQVTKIYGDGVNVAAVQDVTMTLRAGDLVALVGPSGSGKSTLLGLLGLLDQPSSGALWLDGREVTGFSDRERTRLRASLMGFVFQQFNLITSLSARQNVEAALLYRGLSGRRREELADDALERVGLAHRGDHRPSQLSGGEQQRVALARAVVSEPKLIIADEPTGNLDSANAAGVLDGLERFVSAGVAVIVATHDPTVAGRAHRQLVMSDGRLREER